MNDKRGSTQKGRLTLPCMSGPAVPILPPDRCDLALGRRSDDTRAAVASVVGLSTQDEVVAVPAQFQHHRKGCTERHLCPGVCGHFEARQDGSGGDLCPVCRPPCVRHLQTRELRRRHSRCRQRASYRRSNSRYALNSGQLRWGIRGVQAYSTILLRKAGSTGDWWTVNGSNYALDRLTLDGNANQGTTGDNLVLNGPYSYFTDANNTEAAANAVTIGKAAAAIAWRIEGVLIRLAKRYGIQTIAASGSTDGMISNTDVGQCGWSGIRFDTFSQNGTNVHSWGNGIESDTDYHGFYINSGGNIFTNWQSETNLGSGLYLNGSGSPATSSPMASPGRMDSAGSLDSTSPLALLEGNQIFRNGVKNTGVASASFSGIRRNACTEWVIGNNLVWDDTSEVPASTYAVAPAYPYPGRPAGFYTQS